MIITVAPAVEPLLLEMVKAQAKIDSADEDALLGAYIVAARQAVENYLHRALITQTWQYTFDGFDALQDKHFAPFQSVTSITYLDINGAVQTLASNQYRTVIDRGLIEQEYAVTWPPTRPVSAAVTVTLVMGFGATWNTIPETIRIAMLMMINHWFENRVPYSVGQNLIEMPMTAEYLLNPYRLIVV
jgi:uncharacterized phiE125 gp8 family phage protein